MNKQFSNYLKNKRQYNNSINNITQSAGNKDENIREKSTETTNFEKKTIQIILSKDKRTKKRQAMYNSTSYKYNGNIFLLGCGAIGKALLFMIFKILKLSNTSVVTIIDKQNLQIDISQFLDKVKYIQQEITEDNYKDLFASIRKNDLIIDCAYGISTCAILLFCQEKECHYVSSAIDEWDFKDFAAPLDASIYNKYQRIEKTISDITNKKFNALLTIGCNPGNVSIWTKYGLDLINKKYNHPFTTYAELSKKLGIQVIHVSEKDGQLNSDPKKSNEYCNTWSTDAEAYYEEALGFAEGSWGTHEKTLPANIISTDNHHFIIDRLSIHSYAQSYVPLYGSFIGNIIPHEESYTIGKYLTIKSGDTVSYKPSVYYIYHPTNDAKMSIEELKDKNYSYQKYYRLLTKEITDGRDELGVTFFLENGDVYWIGSLLNITEAREIYDNNFNDNINATITQVVAGYISGIIYMIKLIDKINQGTDVHKGIIYAEDLPHKDMLKWSLPFLGDFAFEKVEDFHLQKINLTFTGKNETTKDWQFNNFLVYK
jgi:homospermidine synthase